MVMENINIELQGIRYLVRPDGDTFALIVRGQVITTLIKNTTRDGAAKWETQEGYKNQLVDTIGKAIDNAINND